jgi:hypothetical protein
VSANHTFTENGAPIRYRHCTAFSTWGSSRSSSPRR